MFSSTLTTGVVKNLIHFLPDFLLGEFSFSSRKRKSVNYNDEDRIAMHQEPDSEENAENYPSCQFLRDFDDRCLVSRIMGSEEETPDEDEHDFSL